MVRPLTVSLVTPNFNGAEFIERTLTSVLSQGYPDLDYVVVDGASTDGSLDIIEKYRSSLSAVISEPDQGHTDAIHKGFGSTHGDIMGWINSDDMLLPGCLAAINEVFNDFPDVDWITGRATAMTENNVVYTVREARPWSWVRFLAGDYRHIQQESTFWRRSLWDKAGGYLSTDHKLASDFELWTRFFLHAPLYSVDALLGSFRFRPGQQSRASADEYDAECVSALRSLWESMPVAAISQFADVLGAPYSLQPSFDFPAVSTALAGADAPFIAVDHGTKKFTLNGVAPHAPAPPRTPVVEQADLAFDGERRVVWHSGPDFAVSDFAGLEVTLHSDVLRPEHSATIPLLAGPVAIYDFGGGRLSVEIKLSNGTVSTHIQSSSHDLRLKIAAGATKLLVILNGTVIHREDFAGHRFSDLYSNLVTLATDSPNGHWSGEITLVRSITKSSAGVLATHELHHLPEARQPDAHQVHP